MLRHFILLSLGIALVAVTTGCTQSSAPQLRIVPQTCELQPGGQISLSLDGTIPQNASIQWQASAGSIVSTGLMVSAVFTAPPTPGAVTVTAIIQTGTPNPPVSLVCNILSPTDNSPTNPALPNPPSATIDPASAIVISEVMGNTCGGDHTKKWNQYVELHNQSEQFVDVGGWWLADAGSVSPDQIVAWAARNDANLLPPGLVANSTILPPHGTGLVLSPSYPRGEYPYTMPYANIPAGTVILTIAASDRLGDDVEGLQVFNGGHDVVVIYIGGPSIAQKIISTFGAPLLSAYPQDFADSRSDDLPLDLQDCESVERKDLAGPDIFGNWRAVLFGSPGEVPGN